MSNQTDHHVNETIRKIQDIDLISLATSIKSYIETNDNDDIDFDDFEDQHDFDEYIIGIIRERISL